jgi:hypothetical protein
MTNEYTVQTVVPAGSGIAMLSAAPQGADAAGLPTSWCTGAIGFLHLRGTALVLDQVNSDVDRIKPATAKKPGTTKIPNDTYMTRVSANGVGESGSQPLREHPPA